ncbi:MULTISPECIES: lytic transglycosylase domain-containing protein [Gammaproteobacteria]|jgi:soluble lytic murein transglycosylase-like protein|uniref:Transglycosylase SLT domain-containing protein n=1 Tax=Vreelandella halophila TaxID=86177 RepID=A0A9X5B531_9GAMM|nr:MULTISPECIES: lytic transglycosylase domain-containing protein [Gammaproteobacteria]KAA8985333.1 lytic transglycosylase domain-containing protein [Halospina sp. K52047b]MYL25752.1 transglycosylase SLT domain-containing protein [Halomonas utahensis]MYL75698.1 transglycosylase SLT domain-containing protein [Halomonas sp. 22501_18_FS]
MRTAVSIAVLGLALLLASPIHAATSQPDPELRSKLREAVNAADSFDDRFDAEVWLVDMSGRTERWLDNHDRRLRILRLVHREASRRGLSPEVVLAVIQVESGFDRFAISPVGAQGLMQVMPFWKKEIGRPEDNLTKVETNLVYGTTILAHYLEKEDGNLAKALARYNGSVGKVWYPERVFDALEQHFHVNR